MARFAKLLHDGNFASGVTYYVDQFPGDQDDQVRVVISIIVAGVLAPFIVDTGAPWCVLDPLVVPMNRVMERARRQTETATPPAPTKEEVLLAEIRDLLRQQQRV